MYRALFFVLPFIQSRGHIILVSLPVYSQFRHYPHPVAYLGQIIPSDYPWSDGLDGYSNPSQTHYSNQESPSNKPPVILEYKPMRPFVDPKPGNTLTQTLAPGDPWPNQLEPHQTPSENKIKDKSPNLQGSTNQGGFVWESEDETTKQSVSLEFQNVGPTNPENDPNFTQSSTSPNLENRNKDSKITSSTTQINLEYQPNRPSFHPNPGNTLGQIIPPGKPWPSNPEDYQNFTQTSPNLENKMKDEKPSLQESTSQSGFIWESEDVTTEQSINLENQPIRPPHHPNPGSNLEQPWPANPITSPNLEDRNKESEITSKKPFYIEEVTSSVDKQTQINLEYQPSRPSFHPNPGSNLGQIIPSGKPWPDSLEGYQNSTVDLVDRNKDTTTSTTSTNIGEVTPGNQNLSDTNIEESFSSSVVQQQKPVTLEYQPNRPFFHPKPGGTLGQIVPPGQPWPDSPQGYQNFSQVTSPTISLVNRGQEDEQPATSRATQEPTPIVLGYKPTRPFYHPNSGNNLGQIIPPGKPWPVSPEGYQNFNQIASPKPTLVDRIKEDASSSKPPTSTTTQKQTPPSLEYKPTRPFYHPNPGNNLGQIIPSGSSWPSSSQGYQTSLKPNLVDRIKEDAPSSKPPTSTTTQKQTPPSLEYKPTRPFYHPNPGNNLGQIVPSGSSWPSSSQGYQTSLKPNLVDRIKEDEPTTPRNTPKQTPLSLGYKPTRPFYHPNPGSTLGQIIPPGKPWPANPEGYRDSTQALDLSVGIKSATTQSGFIRKTETSSELGQNENKQETSTIDQELESATEGRLYTSALLEDKKTND